MVDVINNMNKTRNKQAWQAFHCFNPPKHKKYHEAMLCVFCLVYVFLYVFITK